MEILMETIIISKQKYERLLKQAELLGCLESGGVDNWEGYYESTKDFYKDDEDEEY